MPREMAEPVRPGSERLYVDHSAYIARPSRLGNSSDSSSGRRGRVGITRKKKSESVTSFSLSASGQKVVEVRSAADAAGAVAGDTPPQLWKKEGRERQSGQRRTESGDVSLSSETEPVDPVSSSDQSEPVSREERERPRERVGRRLRFSSMAPRRRNRHSQPFVPLGRGREEALSEEEEEEDCQSRPSPKSLPLSLRVTALDYYEVLGVAEDASIEAIRERFKELILQLHPDRVRHADPNLSESQRQELFFRINNAHNVLTNATARAKYDLTREGLWDHHKYKQATRLQKSEAITFIENSKETYALKVAAETEVEGGGLVLCKAIYGVLPDTGFDLTAQCLDVLLPLQCLVEDSKLVVVGGETKKWMPGFWDPSEGESEDLRLRLLYEFQSKLHAAEFKDLEDIKIPRKAHLLDASKRFAMERGKKEEKESKYYKRLKERRVRRRRIVVGVGVLAFTLLILRRRPQLLDYLKSSMRELLGVSPTPAAEK